MIRSINLTFAPLAAGAVAAEDALITGRPDFTGSAVSVEPGHFQLDARIARRSTDEALDILIGIGGHWRLGRER